MQKKILLLLIATSLTLFAYNDSDMDGISDKKDKCPNTPFYDLVNSDGCSKKSLISVHKFNIVVGMSLATNDDTDTLTGNLQLNYNYKNFSAHLSSSYYNSDSTSYSDSGTNDSYAGISYRFAPKSIKKLYIYLSAGLIIPTYDSSLENNNLDYTSSLSLSYMPKNINFFARYSATMINDDDTTLTYDDGTSEPVYYQNTSSYNLGAGFYPSMKTYLSLSYNSSESIYKGAEDIETLSMSLFYNIDTKMFTSISYAYGLSDNANDNYASLKLGYYF